MWELPSSSAPPALDQPKSPIEQLVVVYLGLKQLSSTALAIARLKAGQVDLYKPGTWREHSYMCGIALVYQDNCIEDTATITATVIRRDIIGGVEVYTQDAEFELDKLDKLV